MPLKHLARISVSNVDKKSAEGEVPVRLVNYTDVYYGDRISPRMDLMAATATGEQVSAFRVQPGDVLITKDSETAADIGIAAYVEASEDDMVLGYHLALLRPNADAIEGRFLYWAVCSDDARGQLSSGATGVTRFGLRTDAIGSVGLSVPTPAVQRSIAVFLDTETARIDALIAKKRRMIDLLHDRTRSAVDRWMTCKERIPLKRLVRYQEGPGIMAKDFREAGIPLIRVAGVGGKYVTLSGCNYLDADAVRAKWSHFALDEGDYVISASASMGTVSLVDTEAAGAIPYTGLIRFKPATSLVEMEMIRYFLGGADFMRQIDQMRTGTAIQHFGPSHLDQVSIPDLSLADQRASVFQIARVEAQAYALIDRIRHQVALLQERRQALITAAVTGDLAIPGTAA